MMQEDYHPWYIRYTSPVWLLAMLFYQPASLLTKSICAFFGYGSSMLSWHIGAFVQSLLLSLFVWKVGRRKSADTKPGIKAPPL